MIVEMFASMWVKKFVAMLTNIQSAGVASEVTLRSLLHADEKARKQGIHPSYETQGRHHQKSKTGISVSPQKFIKNCPSLL